MPLVRISLKQDHSPASRKAIADTVHRALVNSLSVPEGDRFQIVSSHGDDLIYDPAYLGIQRTDGIVIIQVQMAAGRTVEQKKRLYREIAETLAANNGIRPQDVFVNLVEVARENWSFGDGIAQYADAAPAHLAALAQG